jgi:hypothetical protein
MPPLTRNQRIAADMYGYSYAQYVDQLKGKNKAFTRTMPKTAESLERAEKEGWGDARIAKALDVEERKVRAMVHDFREARQVVDAPSIVEGFRIGVRQLVREAVDDDRIVENLVTQICFRAADLGYLLAQERKRLSDYTEALQTEPDIEMFSG